MIQNQAGAGLAPLGNFCITENAQRCQTGTRWFQQLKGTSYPKPLKKFIHIFVWGSDPLATRLIEIF